MKSTGIVRTIDDLGRIVIPKEVRDKFSINVKQPMEILDDEQYIILGKYEYECVICGRVEGLNPHGNKTICPNCAKEARQMD